MDTDRFRALVVLRDAWHLFKGAWRVYLLMALTIMAASWLATRTLSLLLGAPSETVAVEGGQESSLGTTIDVGVFGMRQEVAVDGAARWVIPVVDAAIAALFAGSLAVFGLRRAARLDVRYSMLFEHFRYFPRFFALGLGAFAAVSILGRVGPLLLLAVAVASVVFVFVEYFIVDRDMGVIEALQRSAGLVSRYAGQTVALIVIGAVGQFAATLPLLLTTSWFGPGASLLAGVATGIAGIFVAGLFSVAFAAAFRDATGLYTAGGGEPLEHGYDPTAVGRGA